VHAVTSRKHERGASETPADAADASNKAAQRDLMPNIHTQPPAPAVRTKADLQIDLSKMIAVSENFVVYEDNEDATLLTGPHSALSPRTNDYILYPLAARLVNKNDGRVTQRSFMQALAKSPIFGGRRDQRLARSVFYTAGTA